MKNPYDLVGQNGNAFSLMGYTKDAMREAYREARQNQDEEAMKLFGRDGQDALMKDAMSLSYNHLVAVLNDMIREVNAYLGLEEE